MKIAEHELTYPVALQRNWSTSRDYGMFATPAGYMIDAAGVIDSPAALGIASILKLAGAEPGATGTDPARIRSSRGFRVA
jgi:hypothetical protein